MPIWLLITLRSYSDSFCGSLKKAVHLMDGWRVP